MKAILTSTFAGCCSIVWMAGGFALFYVIGLVVERHDFRIESAWLPTLMVLVEVGWLGAGFGLAISGLRRGNLAARICGCLSLIAFAFAVWGLLSPLYVRVVAGAQARAPVTDSARVGRPLTIQRHSPGGSQLPRWPNAAVK